MSSRFGDRAEWLEADGLGGFASGTVAGLRTRRYHALLLTATEPPVGRVVLVNGFDAWVETPVGSFPITSQHYTPDVVYPDGARRRESFQAEPWPRWVIRLDDNTRIEHQLFVPRGSPVAVLSWRLRGTGQATIWLRPFLSGRDPHALHRENPNFRFDPEAVDGRVTWRPYAGVPGIVALHNGTYHHQPDWYRNFLYEEERARGLDCVEDLASPGLFRFDLAAGEAVWLVSTESGAAALAGAPVAACHERLRSAERARREAFPTRLHRAADDYVVARGAGRTIIAGYPWFTDWGRDTFVALRGLCLATGRLEDARQILVEWAGAVSEGMLPNRFPDHGEAPEYNSVDAALWYVVAVHEFLQAAAAARQPVARREAKALGAAVSAILGGYARGTRFGIRADADGLLAAGEPGVQLTWMDAKVGDWVVTPRVGKPVEVQALWLNALRIGSAVSEEWAALFARGIAAFRERFWNEERGCLYDVVDVDHVAGRMDGTLRPNQVLAVGGLPAALVDGDRARRIVDTVEAKLCTPVGLRSLAPGEPGYTPYYRGDVQARDAAYHQGTVWPWLMGPFVEAWVRVRGGTPEARRDARIRFLDPLLARLGEAGLGHLSEIADGDPPHIPRGCPFQAWSVGEALRLSLVVL